MDVTTSINPVKIIEIADEDNNNDDVSVIYSTPRTSKRKRTKITDPISVEDYFEKKNLEIFRSKASSNGTGKVIIDLSKEYPDDEIQIFGSRFSLPSSKDPKGCSNSSNTNSINNNISSVIPQVIQIFGSKYSLPSSKDPKGCSNSSNKNLKNNNNIPSVISQVVSEEYRTYTDLKPTFDDNFICEICVDEKSMTENFKIMGCNHSYCNQCTANYIASKLQQNITRISCPVLGCNGQLEPYNCRSILPKQVFDRWGDVLCEAMILGCEKFDCPLKDCSALLIDDSSCDGGDFVVTQSECPECRRLFCAKCKVAWHSGILCEEFQKLNKDEREKEDLQLMQLAKGQEWQRCPRCQIYIVRSSGCAQMRCRCGCYFCYKCGAESTNHHCKRCGT
ncbi:uncharacterized protein LOC132620254 [Lycium barbarum]|uniref:uncharacterized protein LOC132620254 n=1 Tax=Lycium barbarum TaxID=112863 RepID=UPI00293E7CE7|nr:uncharacterized protein LOC132620254 [Lycium barbarum]